MAAGLQNPIFTDPGKAREALEAVRWPAGPVCPHCGATGEKIGAVKGRSHRPGLLYCGGCKGQFTVTVGTVFERSKIPLTKWWLAVHLLSVSKKGMSSHQLGRMLGVTYKTAWFMAHRVREAMRELNPGSLGGQGKAVEADETYGHLEQSRLGERRAADSRGMAVPARKTEGTSRPMPPSERPGHLRCVRGMLGAVGLPAVRRYAGCAARRSSTARRRML